MVEKLPEGYSKIFKLAVLEGLSHRLLIRVAAVFQLEFVCHFINYKLRVTNYKLIATKLLKKD